MGYGYHQGSTGRGKPTYSLTEYAAKRGLNVRKLRLWTQARAVKQSGIEPPEIEHKCRTVRRYHIEALDEWNAKWDQHLNNT